MNIINMACYVLAEFSSPTQAITPLKLQKLLYYVKAWSLVAGDPLLPEPFLKWKYGPVNKSVYSEFAICGSSPINKPDNKNIQIKNSELVDFIIENYIEFGALTLSSMTHNEDPWKNTPMDEIIDDELIKDYYSKQPFANNFPINPQNKFYPVMSDMNHAFIFDMTSDDIEAATVFNSYNEYKELKKKAKQELKKSLKKLAN